MRSLYVILCEEPMVPKYRYGYEAYMRIDDTTLHFGNLGRGCLHRCPNFLI